MAKHGWRHLLHEVGPGFVEYLEREQVLQNRTHELADAVSDFLLSQIQYPAQALQLVKSVPLVMGCCNEQQTYENPGAAHAYMWLHFLDRYIRTWRALETALVRVCLPMARNGVNVLDVGTGPGSAAMAIADFYHFLAEYGIAIDEPRLEQHAHVTCFETSTQTNLVRHLFVETINRHIELAHAMPDFASFEPDAWRAAYERHIRDDQYPDETTECCEPWYSRSDINDSVQRLHRYKLVVFSNFLTTIGFARSLELTLSQVFLDLGPGSAVMVLGAAGGVYPRIYEFVDALAKDTGLTLWIVDESVCAESSSEQIAIHAAGRRIYQHLSSLTDVSTLPAKIQDHFGEFRPWPSRSLLRVYRKGTQHDGSRDARESI